MGSSPSTIKAVLPAATWAVSMGITNHTVPRFFREICQESAERLRRQKGPVGIGRQWLPKPNTLPSGVVVAAAVLSTVAGLNVGEMAWIKVRELDGIRGMITYWDEKVTRITYFRRLGPWALRWVRCLHWWTI